MVVVLLLVLGTGGASPARAQALTIPAARLPELVLRVPLAAAAEAAEAGEAGGGRLRVGDAAPAVAFADGREDVAALAAGLDLRSERLLGVPPGPARGELAEAAVLALPAGDRLVTVLNDLVAFEGGVAVAALWERRGDALALARLVPEVFDRGIGFVAADAAAVFPDGSLLLVLRAVQEGVFHELTFLRVPPEGPAQRLLRRRFYHDPGRPHTPPARFRGLGYRLSEDFAADPRVRLTALQQAVVPLYGSEDGAVAGTLAPERPPATVDLWARAQQR